MRRPCDCCEGVHVATESSTSNAPGLDSLHYRIGTHATFFETMQARLASSDYPALAALKTRETSDPAIALLDSWALVGDVLTFYQERIANEGYLRTARERRSIFELGRLVGYQPRPGVSASTYLAYTLDDNAAPVTIPAGALSNSVPGPGETQQAFETSDPLEARASWNALKPRLTRPQYTKAEMEKELYLEGTATKLNPADAMLIDDGTPTLYFVDTVTADSTNNRTVVTLRDASGERLSQVSSLHAEAMMVNTGAKSTAVLDRTLTDIVGALKLSPSLQPKDATMLSRDIKTIYGAQADTAPRLLTTLSPGLSASLYLAWQGVPKAKPADIHVYALRVQARPFGHNAPPRLDRVTNNIPVMAEWAIDDPLNTDGAPPPEEAPAALIMTDGTTLPPVEPDHHEPGTLFLDADYNITPGSYAVIMEPSQTPLIEQPTYTHRSLTAYGLSGKTVELDLATNWFKLDGQSETYPAFSLIRGTKVYTGAEELALGEVPISDDVAEAEIELGGLYDAIQPGRWLIVEGTRTDVGQSSGVTGTELAMVASVAQKMQVDDNGTPLPGEKIHTFLTLAAPLAYTYGRTNITIYGNVVHATNGQTRQETLGSGDATLSYQTFTLKQSPLTYVSAATTSGAQSTLVTRVNDIEWHETDTLSLLGPKDREYVTKTSDAAATSLIFGDGKHGARLPTGTNNVAAVYRSGMGKGGNVEPDQVTLLSTRPLGVKAVTNPLRGSGGADAETRDETRANVPVALMALDRLVSITDYADFSRVFAGVGKAAARFIPGRQQQTVQVVIAGAGDIPIDPTSDLFTNLRLALRKFGDPYLPIHVVVRDMSALVVSANVKIDPDYEWESVEPNIRKAVLHRFSFDQSDLADSVYLADASRVIQAVPGVVYVDIDVFDAVSEATAIANFTAQQAIELKRKDRIDSGPTGLIYMPPGIPDILVLQEVKS
jgi:predicted phage baseplate assembly protein